MAEELKPKPVDFRTFGKPSRIVDDPRRLGSARLAAPPGSGVGMFQAARDALELDTGIGQILSYVTAAGAYDLPLNPAMRPIDPDFDPLQHIEGYERYADELASATSAVELEMLKARIDRNVELRTNLDDYGLTRLAANFVDPINFVPMGFALNSTFRAGFKTALLTGSVPFTVSEAVRHELDHTSTITETALNVAGGMLFMGLMGGVMAKLPARADQITVGRATQKALDAIIPPDALRGSQTRSSIGIPLGFGILENIYKRSARAAGSAANKVTGIGEQVGKRVQRKDGKKIDADIEPGIRTKDGSTLKLVEADWYPRGYVDFGANAASVNHGRLQKDLAEQKARLEDETFVNERSEQLGMKPDEFKKTIEQTIKDTEAELKQSEEFFAREDVQKQMELEKSLGVDKTKKIKDLDDYELVNKQELDEINGIHSYIRNDLREYTAINKQMSEAIADLKKQINDLKQKKRKTKSKSWKTRYKTTIAELEGQLPDLQFSQRLAEARQQEIRSVISSKNARELIMDWNLTPTMLAPILQNTTQFPWWYLLKNPFRQIDPVLGRDIQEFALKMASSPGLNTHGSAAYRSLGNSVESMKAEWTGPFIAAKKKKEQLYLKYMGLGEDTTQLQTYWMDNFQRWRGGLEKIKADLKGEPRPVRSKDNRLSLSEWNEEVSRAILEGKHDIPEVMEAAQGYIEIWKKMSETAVQMRIFATQRNLKWSLVEVDKELANLEKQVVDAQKALNNIIKSRGGDDNPLRPMVVKESDGLIIAAKQSLDRAKMKRDRAELDRMELEKRLEAYEIAASKDPSDGGYFHVMYDLDALKANRQDVVDNLFNWFKSHPDSRVGDTIVKGDDIEIRARAEETYSSMLREAELGESIRSLRSVDKREWLEARKAELQKMYAGTKLERLRSRRDIEEDIRRADIEQDQASKSRYQRELEDRSEKIRGAKGKSQDTPEAAARQKDRKLDDEIVVAFRRVEIIDAKLAAIEAGTPTGSAGPLLARELDIPPKELNEWGIINRDIDQIMSHYVFRMAAAIETNRAFGSPTAQGHIIKLVDRMNETVEELAKRDPVKALKLKEKIPKIEESLTDIRDIVHGFYQIPDNPMAITPRILRVLRNWNILAAMGRSTMMALGDTGNIVISQGFERTFGHMFGRMVSGVHGGNIRMIDREVELAGAVTEVALGMRFAAFTETGANWHAGSRFEKAMGNGVQRFFMHNLMGPWTDMARKVAGGLVQSELVRNSLLWRDGKLSPKDAKIMSRLNINKEDAIQIANEWEKSGQLKHKSMFIANTEQWKSDITRRKFRAAINDEVNRAVINPGAVDKPKAMLKSEWWKVIGQYKGFGISASHRIMAAGLQQEGASKISGFASMIGIAALVDGFKRPDYIQMSTGEQVLRAVELSGVTGILLDLNDTIERASAGAVGLRPALGMDIRERNPNWANRVGALAGAVPNQWLTLMYGLTSDEASTNDAARGIRYMMPYNNLWLFNEQVNRIQRASVDYFED